MALGSSIEWTESTWNPVTGCTKLSPGCKHCYAERMAERLQAMGQPNYRNGFQLAHRFQVLTKRADRLAALNAELRWPGNVWVGVSVENASYLRRIDDLRGTGAKVKFLSLEPMLGPISRLDLHGIDWVIVGGESGPRARSMEPAWVTEIRDQCRQAGVAFFFKQWGGANKKKAGRLLEGRTWDELPTVTHPTEAALASRIRSLRLVG